VIASVSASSLPKELSIFVLTFDASMCALQHVLRRVIHVAHAKAVLVVGKHLVDVALVHSLLPHPVDGKDVSTCKDSHDFPIC